MADDFDDDGGASTQTMEAPAETGGNEIPQVVQDKFDEVFGDKPAGKPAAPAKQSKSGGTDGAKKAPTGSGNRRRSEEESESLASLEDATTEDTNGESFEGDEDDAEADDATPASKKEAVPAGKQAGKDGQDAAPTLDPLLRQAAKRGGFTNDEIDNLWKNDPELAEKTFGRLYTSFSDLAARYGRLAGDTQQPRQQPQARQQQRQPAPAQNDGRDDGALGEIYGDKIHDYAEKYGKDFVDDILTPLVQKLQQPVTEMYGHYQRAQQDAIASEARQFLSGLPAELHDLYGKGHQVTDEQLTARKQLSVLADRIRNGAQMQGEHMTVTEALDLACMSHAKEFLSKIERQKLVSQVKRRAASLTARPTQRRDSKSASNSGKQGIEAAMEAYASRASELGIELGG